MSDLERTTLMIEHSRRRRALLDIHNHINRALTCLNDAQARTEDFPALDRHLTTGRKQLVSALYDLAARLDCCE